METALHDDLDAYHYMDDKEAFSIVRQYMNLQQPVNSNPVSRYYRFHDSIEQFHPKNVIIILMESMATWKMKTFGNTENRTPFLDSLYHQGIAFANMYSAGIHTHVGVYATHVSYPVIFDHHPMRGIFYKKYYALPQILLEKGYHTLFFVPHGKTFDNLGAFLDLNGFEKIYYDKDYPSDSLRSVWGVDDHFLLHYAIRQIDSLTARSNKPFMATVLTVSDHRPFYIPDFIPGENEEVRATRFADYALKTFFESAKQKPWFKNTLFVFAADHGETHHMIYPTPLTYNHMAAIFYGQGIKPQIINRPVSQLDIFPTIMHLLHLDFLNMTFGLDALTEYRPYVFFNHDNLYGVLDNEFLLVANRQKILGLYRYQNKDKTNYAGRFPEISRNMHRFLQAHIQTAAYILKNNLQELKTATDNR
ncbi:MAG: LTA synthase family protein [Chlorobi bacterium]|nr:LTA synthase family protein [Chlorobiota bacterium]